MIQIKDTLFKKCNVIVTLSPNWCVISIVDFLVILSVLVVIVLLLSIFFKCSFLNIYVINIIVYVIISRNNTTNCLLYTQGIWTLLCISFILPGFLLTFWYVVTKCITVFHAPPKLFSHFYRIANRIWRKMAQKIEPT